MKLFCDTMSSPIGSFTFCFDRKSVVYSLDWNIDDRSKIYSVERYYKEAEITQRCAPKTLMTALDDYFSGDLKAIERMTVALPGTAFQKSVWKALCEIPAGRVCSYKDIAKKLDNPGAMRAVGMANNANPIAIIVPCHRVIGASGKMVGYGSGVERKEWLLRHEGVMAEQSEMAF